MFRTAFSVPPPVHSPDPANTAAMGLNPIQLLSLASDRLRESGVLKGKVAKARSILRGRQCTGWHF
jgi:hypothetical protein